MRSGQIPVPEYKLVAFSVQRVPRPNTHEDWVFKQELV
jgi:hypothetical protein